MNNRKTGALIGLAIGDAVGATLEFQYRDMHPPVEDMVGGGVHDLKPGQWTDDTSMALCLGYSLKEKGFDVEDQLDRYLKWYEKGYCSSKNHCFDIGITTKFALINYKRTHDTIAEYSTHSAGNGALMRLAPIPIYYNCPEYDLESIKDLLDKTRLSSMATHNNEISEDACAYFSLLLNRTFNGLNKEQIIDLPEDMISILDFHSEEIKQIAIDKSFLFQHRDEIKSSGFVIHSLNAALWAFYTTDNFKDAILKATNLADDSDTVAAICGMIAGAYYGLDGIPEEWIKKLHKQEDIKKLAANLIYSKK